MLKTKLSSKTMSFILSKRNFFSVGDEKFDVKEFIQGFQLFDQQYDLNKIHTQIIAKTSQGIEIKGQGFKDLSNAFFLEDLDAILPLRKQICLKQIMKKSNLLKLSKELEILQLLESALFPNITEDHKNVNTFFICLDFIAKGLQNHWDLILRENKEYSKSVGQVNTSSNIFTKDNIINCIGSLFPSVNKITQYMDNFKVPLLIGDLFHTKAYFLASQIGITNICQILSNIDENFAFLYEHIHHNTPTSHISTIIELSYKNLYYYLPSFFAHSLRGIALFKDNTKLEMAFNLGKEFGYFIQYYTFALIAQQRLLSNEMYNTSSMKKPDNPLVTNIGYFIGENYLFPLTPKGRNGNIRDLYLKFFKLAFYHLQNLDIAMNKSNLHSHPTGENSSQSLFYLLYNLINDIYVEEDVL